MTIREEMDSVYEKMWEGANRVKYFRFLLERFIPFSRWRFSLKETEEGALGSLIYFSPHIRLKITPDFEMHKGLGSIRFLYSRPNAPRTSREKLCWPWIDSNPSGSPYFHFFLERISPELTKTDSELPVKKAFERIRSADNQLKELNDFEPAYAAALEAFCWDYYGNRLFRLFQPDNQSERDKLAQYAHEYYKVNFSPEAIGRWEEKQYLPPPWKLCL